MGLVARLRGAWAFVLAASSVPHTSLLAGSCTSTGCASCPLGGACMLSLPLVFVGAAMVKGFRRLSARRHEGGLINIDDVPGSDR